MTSLRTRGVLAVVVWLAAATAASAQGAGPITPDRPDFTEGAGVVAPRVVQFESGVLWEQDMAGGRTAKQLSLPNTLIRLGMTPRFELRSTFQGLIRQHAGGPRSPWTSSASDLEIGGKYQLAHQEGLGLDLAILAFVSLPTGGTASSGNADPTVKFAWARDVGQLSLSGNFNASWVTNGQDTRDRLLEASLSVGHPLWGRWSAFWEAVGSTIDAPESPAAWTANAGITRLFGDDVQIDVHVGRGLTDAASDWAIGTGLSFRFRR